MALTQRSSTLPGVTSTPTKPSREEQEPASDEITEVAPGVLRMQLPISMPGLGHVNCYALEDERGVAVVDPGLPGPEPWQALEDRLAAAGFPTRRVHTVIVTHSHPDHFGGANHLRRETGADIVTHALFQNWWDPGDDRQLEATGGADDGPVDDVRSVTRRVVEEGRTPWGTEHQRGPMSSEHAKVPLAQLREWFTVPRSTVRLEDAQTTTLAGREWVAVHTPGHTPDHLCLFDPAAGVLLSGDHVLPTITPHISGVGSGADPLAGFFASLERMHGLEGVTVVLPAHGHPFTDLDGRVDAIRDHHLERLEVLRRASAELGPASVVELSHRLFKPRSWGQMAESETYAHLEHLRLGDLATRTEVGGMLEYTVT